MINLYDPVFLSSLSKITEPQPILYLDGEGSTIADKSPSARSLAVGAGATISTAQAGAGLSSIDLNNTSTGRIGVTPAISIPSIQGFTLEVMVRPRSLPTYSTIFEIGDHLANNGIVFLLGQTGPCIYNNGFFGSSAVLSLNVWSKIRYVISTVGADRRLYIYQNDVLASNVVIPSGRSMVGVNTIGGSGVSFPTSSTYFFNGFMDELRIWPEALLLP